MARLEASDGKSAAQGAVCCGRHAVMIACIVFVKIMPCVALAFAVLEQKCRGRIVVIALIIDMKEACRKFQRDVECRCFGAVTRARDGLALHEFDADTLVERCVFKK